MLRLAILQVPSYFVHWNSRIQVSTGCGRGGSVKVAMAIFGWAVSFWNRTSFALAPRLGFGAAISVAVALDSMLFCYSVCADRSGVAAFPWCWGRKGRNYQKKSTQFISISHWGNVKWEESWEMREEMRRVEKRWEELKRGEQSKEDLWRDEKSEKRWEELGRGEKSWEELSRGEKSWEELKRWGEVDKRWAGKKVEHRWEGARRADKSWEELIRGKERWEEVRMRREERWEDMRHQQFLYTNFPFALIGTKLPASNFCRLPCVGFTCNLGISMSFMLPTSRPEVRCLLCTKRLGGSLGPPSSAEQWEAKVLRKSCSFVVLGFVGLWGGRTGNSQNRAMLTSATCSQTFVCGGRNFDPSAYQVSHLLDFFCCTRLIERLHQSFGRTSRELRWQQCGKPTTINIQQPYPTRFPKWRAIR